MFEKKTVKEKEEREHTILYFLPVLTILALIGAFATFFINKISFWAMLFQALSFVFAYFIVRFYKMYKIAGWLTVIGLSLAPYFVTILKFYAGMEHKEDFMLLWLILAFLLGSIIFSFKEIIYLFVFDLFLLILFPVFFLEYSWIMTLKYINFFVISGILIFTILNIRDRYYNLLISKQEQLEKEIQRFNLISSMVPIGILRLDAQMSIVYLNDYWIKKLGIKETTFNKINWYDFIHKDDFEMVKEIWIKASKDRVRFSMIYRFLSTEGEVYLAEFKAVPVYHQDNIFSGFVCVIEDVTKQRQIEEIRCNYARNLEIEIQKERKENEKIVKGREMFIMGAAHELKTPLTIIKSNIDLISLLKIPKFFEKNISQIYDNINNEINQMVEIIDRLFYLMKIGSREEYGNLKTNLRIDLIIREIFVRFRNEIKHYNLKLFLELKKTVYYADEDAIKKLFTNLINNAIKYNKTNGFVKVVITENENNIQIKIEDGGIGIQNKHISKIFDSFYRVDKARSRSVGGAGLGLAICKAIIINCKGEIEVESDYGKGTKFIINLPKP